MCWGEDTRLGFGRGFFAIDRVVGSVFSQISIDL